MKSGAKTVALTFDDGPGPDDAALAKILADRHVRATFFETGARVHARPAQARMMAERGQLLGSHSWEHRYPSQVAGGWSITYVTRQIRSSSTEIAAHTGRPVCWFRPPGGFQTNVAAAAKASAVGVALWNVDTLDWKQPRRTTAAATQRIINAATATKGSTHPIVLMHSAKASRESDRVVSSYRGNTVAALPAIIDWYRAHGFVFVGIDGLTYEQALASGR